jgi:hypothetical protein
MKMELKLKYGFDPKVVVNGFCFSYFASLIEKGWALYAEEKTLFKSTGALVRRTDGGHLSNMAKVVMDAISQQLGESVGLKTFDTVQRTEVESFLKTATEFLNIFKEEEK